MGRILLGTLLFIAWALAGRFYWICNLKHLCPNDRTGSVTQNPVANRPKTLSLTAGTQKLLTGYDEFSYDYNSHEANLSENNNKFITDVVAYFSQHPADKLVITGRFYDNEKSPDNSIFDNLGLARAAAMRDILINDHGIDAARLRIDYLKLNAPQNNVSGPIQPLGFSVDQGEQVASPNQPEQAIATYEFSNMTIPDANFESGSAKLTPSHQFIFYADSLTRYLMRNPTKQLRITGHTDADGNDQLNKRLGLDRAKATKTYLAKKGIKNKIDVASEGEAKPVAPNDTPEGKARNRRINIKIE